MRKASLLSKDDSARLLRASFHEICDSLYFFSKNRDLELNDLQIISGIFQKLLASYPDVENLFSDKQNIENRALSAETLEDIQIQLNLL